LTMMFAKASRLMQKEEEEKKQIKQEAPKFRPHEIQSTGFIYRDKLRARLVDILRKANSQSKLSSDTNWPLDCGLRLENEVHRLFKHGKPYTDKARSLIHNLENTQHSNAQRVLLTKEVSPEDFVQGDVRSFASDELKTAREIAEKTNLHNCRSDWDTEQVRQ